MAVTGISERGSTWSCGCGCARPAARATARGVTTDWYRRRSARGCPGDDGVRCAEGPAPGRHRSDEEWVASGTTLLDLLARLSTDQTSPTVVARRGVRHEVHQGDPRGRRPDRRYVGVDTAADIISFLAANVDDPRFAFHHLDAHNELYNPTGMPLGSFHDLPVAVRFDLISLFSVFTHLALPTTTGRCSSSSARMSPTAAGCCSPCSSTRGSTPRSAAAFNQELQRRREAGDLDVIRPSRTRRRGVGSPTSSTGYLSGLCSRPCTPRPSPAGSSRGTGWEVVGLHPPQPSVVQHHFVCRPV